jgi:hypothetical protein
VEKRMMGSSVKKIEKLIKLRKLKKIIEKIKL